jgi:hypothetical protein
MKHTIQFKTAMELLQWLFENNIDSLPVDLIIHLEEQS